MIQARIISIRKNTSSSGNVFAAVTLKQERYRQLRAFEGDKTNYLTMSDFYDCTSEEASDQMKARARNGVVEDTGGFASIAVSLELGRRLKPSDRVTVEPYHLHASMAEIKGEEIPVVNISGRLVPSPEVFFRSPSDLDGNSSSSGGGSVPAPKKQSAPEGDDNPF